MNVVALPLTAEGPAVALGFAPDDSDTVPVAGGNVIVKLLAPALALANVVTPDDEPPIIRSLVANVIDVPLDVTPNTHANAPELTY